MALGSQMNQEETLKLWKQGKEAWNAWAAKMLLQRDDLEKRGFLSRDKLSKKIVADNEQSRRWIDEAKAIFSSPETPTTFSTDLDLSGFIFPSTFSMSCATSHGDINLSQCIFEEEFELKSCRINGVANFRTSRFKSIFSVSETLIKGECNCYQTSFDGLFQIYESKLAGYVNFTTASFLDEFRASDSEFSTHCSFSGAFFKNTADFDECTFLDSVELDWSVFDKSTSIINCSFEADLELNETHFLEDLFLRGNTIEGKTSSIKTYFDDELTITDTMFSGDCFFSYCTFKRSCMLSNVRFDGEADFRASNFSQGLSFRNSEFRIVPDFSQTHFLESPILDGVKIQFPSPKSITYTETEEKYSLVWKYRSLKRLAIQAHDHRKEQEYFAAELKCRRLYVDSPMYFRWWLNFGFDVFSNYGRSILRPLFTWLFSIIFFSYAYLLIHLPEGNYWIDGEGRCSHEQGSALKSAFILSTSKALVFSAASGENSPELAKQCLYGEEVLSSSTSTDFAIGHHVLYSLFYTEVAQVLVSSILVFLVLLGIRNHFKLK